MGGLDSTDMPDSEADELLNMSFWDIEDTFDFENKETLYTSTLVASQTEYDLTGISNLDAIRSVVVIDEQGKRNKLEKMTRDWYDENRDDDDLGLPNRYMREAEVLTVHPACDTTNAGNNLEITIKESMAGFLLSTDTSQLPRNWDKIILYGAVEFGHFLNQDYGKAEQVGNRKIGMIRGIVETSSKEDEDNRYAGVDVITEFPHR
jgi:hypothetical protein